MQDQKTQKSFSVIGIGASAGGLEALKLFFDNVPSNFEHSIVIVQHLSPDHKSLMKELLEKNTSLPILEVKHEMEILPGTVYLIPPGKNMVLKDRKLLLSNKPEKKQLNLPINIFLNSLALEEREKAVSVLLSGTGSDGTNGIKEIHELGGIVIAQNPEESKFDGMPLSAINTGLVDYVLFASQMPSTIIGLLVEDGKTPIEREIEKNGQLYNRLLNHVKNVTSFDFNAFKKPTIVRRVAKRITLGGHETFEKYHSYLLDNKEEAYLLEKEFLISVTDFYRDEEVWSFLTNKVIPETVTGKKKEETLKIWSVGCSTGQEAYTIADSIYQELIKQNKPSVNAKIFASDASSGNIKKASSGIYSADQLKNLDPNVVARMFNEVDGLYHIKDYLRQMVVFSVHNVLEDPPFGKMDFVFCRNLLIYMNKEAQEKIIGTLQYALKLAGVLVMGKSEAIGAHADFFHELDQKNRVFKNIKVSKSLLAQKVSLQTTRNEVKNPSNTLGSGSNSFSRYELIDALNKSLPDILDQSFMLVGSNFQILEAIGNFSKYLKVPEFGFSTNLLDLMPEHVKPTVNFGFNRALKERRKVKIEAIQTHPDKDNVVIDVLIFPESSLKDIPIDKFLLVFMPREKKKVDAVIIKPLADDEKNEHLNHLESELKDARQHLIRLQHELEIRNEELQTSNEELLATNEELQSSNEELQSVNEELYTVNSELNHKVQDLAEANAHINNILKSSDVNTLFLDQDLSIRKFTPGILEHYNISLTDIGRPLAVFTHNFGPSGEGLLVNAKEVLRTGNSFQKEIQDKHGKWFLERISPFFNSKNIVSGVVITFVNIDEIKDAEEKYKSLYNNAPDMFWTLDKNSKIIDCNQTIVEKLGYNNKSDIVGRLISDFVVKDEKIEHEKDFNRFLKEGKIYNQARNLKTASGAIIPIRTNAAAIKKHNGEVDYIIGSLRDVSEIIQVEEKFKGLYDNAPDMFCTVSSNLTITNCNIVLCKKLGFKNRDSVIGFKIGDIVLQNTKENSKNDFDELIKTGAVENLKRTLVTSKGRHLPVRINASVIKNLNGGFENIVVSFRDITELIKAEEQYSSQNKAFQQVLESSMAGYWDWMVQEDTEYLSPTFKKMFGYKDDEMKNSPDSWKEIIHPDDLSGVLEVLDAHIKSKGKIPFDNEVRYYHKDGGIVWAWFKGKVIEWDKDDKPIRMVGCHVDITPLKDYQEELKKSNKQLERFAYVASHDLQEPLRTVMDFSNLIKQEFIDDSDNADLHTYIGFINSASDRMGMLIKSILAYSKIGATSNFEEVSFNEVVANVQSDLLLKIKESKGVVKVNKLPEKIYAKPPELHSLFLNLIGNALKFIKKGTVPEIKIYSKDLKDKVQISIEDNGIGVKPKDREKIFEVFKRLHNSNDYKGTGIGLAHCKKIVELHNGSIWLDANENGGSTVHFTISKKL